MKLTLIAHSIKNNFGYRAAAMFLKSHGFSCETALFVLTGKAV